MRVKIFPVTAFLLFVLFLSGCNGEAADDQKEQNTVTVYTTIYPIEDFTKKLVENMSMLKVSTRWAQMPIRLNRQ